MTSLYNYNPATIAEFRVGRRPMPREHGTERGYQQHRYYKDERCEACKKAHVVHNTRRVQGSTTAISGRIEAARTSASTLAGPDRNTRRYGRSG